MISRNNMYIFFSSSGKKNTRKNKNTKNKVKRSTDELNSEKLVLANNRSRNEEGSVVSKSIPLPVGPPRIKFDFVP